MIISLLFVSIGMLSGCSDDDSETSVEFDRAALLANVGANVIVPAFQDFETQAADLNTAIGALTTEVNQPNLDAAQTAWLNAATAWKRAEIFDLGPVDQLNVKFDIQNFPVNIIGIEDEVSSQEVFTQDEIESLSANRKGISTIEYLLFDKDNGDDSILELLINSENRKNYLIALTQNLSSTAAAVSAGWNPAEGNYLATFEASTGTTAASSINVLANDLIILVEEVKNEKLGVPLGKKSLGTLLPDNVEARFSGLSTELILANLTTIENVFRGNGTAGDQLGYADYLDAVDAEFEGEALSSAILTEINTLRTNLGQIDGPISEAVSTDFDDVEAAYISAQRMVRLLKTDMINALALTITFTDNDGD